jgi:hypothetical protein
MVTQAGRMRSKNKPLESSDLTQYTRDHLTQEQGAAMERVANALANEAADHPM